MNNLLKTIGLLDTQKIAIAAVAVAAFYYFFLFNDGSTIEAEISQIKQQFEAEEVKKKDTDATLQEERRMKEAVGILSEQYQIISKKLPTQLSELEINAALETYARENKVRIKASRPGIPEKMEIVQEVPWEIVVEGRFADIIQFINSVASAERLTRVKSLVVSPSKESVGPNSVLRFEGVVVGYKLAVEEPTGASQ